MEIVNKITRIKVSMLVIDYDFYPRNEISSTNKADIKRAMLAGEVLPPVVVGFLSGTSDAVTDPAALRVVDGVHRVKDALEVYGPDYEIEAQVRKYDNVAEMFYDAMYLNSRHGQKLTPLDIAVVISKNKERFHLSEGDLATALATTIDHIEHTIATRFASNSDEPLKGVYRELAGQRITKAQKQANRSAVGFWSQLHMLNQVIALLESDTTDLSDERVTAALATIRELIDTKVGATCVA